MTSDNAHQPAANSNLVVMLAPEDADTAFVAGVQFARALAGAETAAFVMALEEQAALIRTAVLDAGHSPEKAHLAVEAFEAGPQNEWRQVASPDRPAMWGTA